MEKQLKATGIKNELRIGNSVLFRDKIRTVFQIRSSGCDFSIGGNAYQSYIWEAIKPIPLTEDILLRLGFEKGFYRYEFENYGLKCHKSLKENHWIVSQGFGIQFIELTEIQYLHILQNLFFSLTGEELKFKK